MTVTGFTIQEIADKLEITYKTAHKRLETAGIKPLIKEAIYPETALEEIRNVPGKGRPRKQRDPSREYVDFILEGILKAIKTDEWEQIETPTLHNEVLNKAITDIKNAPNRRSRIKQFDRLFDKLVKYSMESWYKEQLTKAEKYQENTESDQFSKQEAAG
jgi:predicted DNA binding protein